MAHYSDDKWELHPVPTTWKPDNIGKVVSVQVFNKVGKDEIDQSSIRKYVGTLESYFVSEGYLWFKIQGMPEVVKTTSTFDHVEIFNFTQGQRRVRLEDD